MMDDTFSVEVRFRLPAISTKLTGVHVGAEGGWSKTYTGVAPSSPEGAQIDAFRSTDLLEFYSEFGTRIGLEKWPHLGSIFSGDSVSVLTSVLTIAKSTPAGAICF